MAPLNVCVDVREAPVNPVRFAPLPKKAEAVTEAPKVAKAVGLLKVKSAFGARERSPVAVKVD